jgi:surface carbohydrate biosynthesis protein
MNMADKYFVFGESVGQILGTRVKTKFEYSGSLVLNNLDFRRQQEKTMTNRESVSDVAMISTFRSKETELNESHKIIYRSLDKFLANTNFDLLIIGNGISTIEQELELKFLSDVFLKCKFRVEFFRMGGDSYRHLETNKWIVTGQSTLGYESLVTSVPVGFLHPEAVIYNGRDFDATSNLGSSGLFWSRSDDPHEHNRIFTYLDTVSDEQWERDSGWIRDQLMVYDYGNTKIRTYVEGVLADSLESN